MRRMQSEAEPEQQESNDASFTDAVVDMLKHLATQEQGELVWIRQIRERAIAAIETEDHTHKTIG